jgi:4-alpha-glucanotransferase
VLAEPPPCARSCGTGDPCRPCPQAVPALEFRWLPADQGTYVYYDHEALVGILCLEAQRAGAVVIGEDLGTFEPWVRDYLAGRGLLGTSILWFEYAADKAPLAPGPIGVVPRIGQHP